MLETYQAETDYHTILWYQAGPMSKIDKFNIPAFLATQTDLRDRGYTTHLPADLDDPEIVAELLASDGSPSSSVLTWGECLAADVILISDICGGVAVMTGWENSRGACLETFTARLHGKPVVYTDTMLPVSSQTLIDAWGQWA
jgi:hypothetical protein